MKYWGHPRESETEMAFKCGKCKNKHLHDPQEARQLAKAGTFPMTMDGTGPSEIAPY